MVKTNVYDLAVYIHSGRQWLFVLTVFEF
jgi:hypothetical protein